MLVSGLVVHSLAAFDMTIRTRLLAALCGFFLCTVLNAVVGFFASKTANNGLQSIHDGRVVALRDLKIVVDMYAVNIVDASHKVRNGNFTYEEGLAAVLEAKQKIEKHWAQFSSAGARPDVEAAAIREVARTSVDADATTSRLLTALNQRDAAALDRLVRTELYQTIDPVSEAMSKLVDLQLAGASATYDETEAAVSRARWVSIAALAVAALMLAFALRTTLWGTIHPLEAMTRAMRKLAAGDLSQQVPGAGRRDEIGRMAAALEIFKANAAERLRLEQEAGQARDNERLHQQQLEELIRGFRGSVKDVLEAVSQGTKAMSSTAEVLTKVASEASDQAASANGASTEASESVQTVAVATEELAVSIQTIAKQMQQTSAAVQSATRLADGTDADVADLSLAAERVGEVVGLIRTIAEQTNLLALNAAIEAARAGDAGRGFAVVASEVKQLAMQTASATDDISQQVSGIQESTARAVAAIQAIRGRIGDVNNLSASVAAALDQQQSVTHEIMQSITRAAKSSKDVARTMGSVTSAIVATSHEAGQAKGVSSRLTEAAGSLSGAVDDFLRGVASDNPEPRPTGRRTPELAGEALQRRA